jgi:hypothetical protein
MVENTLKIDARIFSDEDEGEIECRGCRARLKILPCDVREGFCFDCRDYWNSDTIKVLTRTAQNMNRKLDEFF